MELKREKTAVFIGHSNVCEELKPKIKENIKLLIEKGVDTFLNGGMGKFDLLCADCVNELKEDYPEIKHYLVIPYRHFNWCDRGMFDEVFCPDFDNFNVRAQIPLRNEWMVKRADYALCFVEYASGGSAVTLRKAMEENLKIINLGRYKK